MRRIFQTPRTALPLALSLVLLAAVGATSSRFPTDPVRPGGSAGLLAALVAAGVVLALFKPRRGLALGAAVLAPAALYFGPLASAAVAACLRAAQLGLGRFVGVGPAGGARLTGGATPGSAVESSVGSPAGSASGGAVLDPRGDAGGSETAGGRPLDATGRGPWGIVGRDVAGPSVLAPEALTDVLTAALAGLAAAALWTGGSMGGAASGRIGGVLVWAGVAGLAQAVVLAAAGWFGAWVRDGQMAPPGRREARLLLDAAGWLLGGVLAATFLAAGVPVGLAVLIAVAALVVELVRQRLELTRGRRQAMTLRQMSMVGRRVGGGETIGTQLELEPIVIQILRECRDLVRPQWLHLEIAHSGGTGAEVERPGWRMGPEGRVEQGAPEPPEAPPPLPGMHRRVAWKVLERSLESGDRTIAILRLWTDPRRTEPDKVRLLDSLLPPLASLLAAVLAERRAGRDALTGVASRAVLEERLELVYERCCNEGSSMAVVMCDVDRFKEINDGFGHAVGDQVLQEIASALARHSRGRDIVCRYGGEEFTILMDGANAQAAVAVAERLRKAVEEIRFDSDGTAILLTASFGVASFPDTYVGSGADLVPLADAALYEAKRRGRNRTLLALGHGHFENARGRRLKGDTRAETIEAPRLFV
jgi:diguanylate cyclase (GGDEF)-like protein